MQRAKVTGRALLCLIAPQARSKGWDVGIPLPSAPSLLTRSLRPPWGTACIQHPAPTAGRRAGAAAKPTKTTQV